MSIIAHAVIYADTPCCPTCGSASAVTWQGRQGSTGQSKDQWTCGKDGRTWQTTARG